MIVSIHQPHFFPWLGYLDRMHRCDLFVILDHVQFERQNYQNRVAIKARHGPAWLVVPVCQRSRSERIMDKHIDNQAGGRHSWGRRLQRTLEHAYGGAPFFQLFAPDVKQLLDRGWENLIDVTLASIELLRHAFEIRTPLVRSSTLGITKRGAQAVLEICAAVGAQAFLGGLGASRRYLDPELFQRAGVQMLWQEFRHPRYGQHPHPERFAEGVSALDLLFNCGPEAAGVLRGGLSRGG
jgi:hypothetical protein